MLAVQYMLPAYVLCRGHAEIIASRELEILTLANLSSLTVMNENDAAPPGCAVSVVNESLSVYLDVQGNLNPQAELEKLRKKIEDKKKQHGKQAQMMNESGYREKVPPHINEEKVAKQAALMQEVLSLEQASQKLERIVASLAV